ncbi:alpha/beta hydrolase [Nocardia transvalensis]|uniref:alpha/beta hydrolase n=1 Tax=Nocardia transvalensis TaxID=37333 RepID=UPI001E6092D2|nr:alpha/beta fold hydrolase [Nocardia transvalensis]
MTIRSGERELAGDLYEADGASAGVLFIHGYESARRSYGPRAEAVRERLGLTCLTFDLSGHGDSPGDREAMSREVHRQDVLAAYDALAERVDRVGVCGASYGAYLACVLLGERPVQRLLLRAPAVHVGEPLRHLVDTDLALHNLAEFSGRTLVLESEHDELIPHSAITACLAAARHGTHHILSGARHAMSEPAWKAAFVAEIVAWFTDL